MLSEEGMRWWFSAQGAAEFEGLWHHRDGRVTTLSSMLRVCPLAGCRVLVQLVRELPGLCLLEPGQCHPQAFVPPRQVIWEKDLEPEQLPGGPCS